jgi:ribonuclease HII
MGRRAIALTMERRYWRAGFKHIAGVDEVGCGSLAGPVVAAAVVLREECGVKGAVDSKLLTASQRAEIAGRVRGRALALGIGAASTREIEQLNVRRATALAMERALNRLPFIPDCVLIDGRPQPSLGDHLAIVKGDRKCHSIACAAIVAKVVRDELRVRLGPQRRLRDVRPQGGNRSAGRHTAPPPNFSRSPVRVGSGAGRQPLERAAALNATRARPPIGRGVPCARLRPS